MFSLVVGVLAAVILALLTLMVIWYGGSVFTTQGDRANYATLYNQGVQIEGALNMYASTNQGVAPAGTSAQIIQTLVDANLLNNVPPGDWQVSGSSVLRPISDLGTCQRYNNYAGLDSTSTGPAGAYDGCPPCSSSDFQGWPGCRLSN